ncbi:MAG: hypothetical protein LQ351_005807 [Letrouitia transgressa]|nr:MAG: hypothetical protein LQ351_005807 [Letrouitia transgressa]
MCYTSQIRFGCDHTRHYRILSECYVGFCRTHLRCLANHTIPTHTIQAREPPYCLDCYQYKHRVLRSEWGRTTCSLLQNAEAIANFGIQLYGSFTSEDFDMIQAYIQKWCELDFLRLDREFYGPRLSPPEGPSSFLYERPCPTDNVCLGQCIELDMDAEPPSSPRSALEREEHNAAILPQGRQPNRVHNHNEEPPTTPEVYDDTSEAGSNDIFPLMLQRYRERRRQHEGDQLAHLSWEIARAYMGRDIDILDLEGSDNDGNESETETWIDDANTTDTNEGGWENRDTNTTEPDAGIEIRVAAIRDESSQSN